MESSALRRGRVEIEEEPQLPPPLPVPATAVEERVYVAVGKDFKEGKNTIIWSLQNFHLPIVVLHVHRPANMIPLLGAKVHASQLQEREVKAYRGMEREKMNRSMDEFLLLCSRQKAKANKIVIEMDDVVKGVVELIARHGITKLVMGAAADKHYSKKMKVPRSKIATAVKEQADSSCDIWFVCKGKLICKRESLLPSEVAFSSISSPSSVSSSTSISRSSSLGKGGALKQMQYLFGRRTSSEKLSLNGSRTISAMSNLPPMGTRSPLCRLSLDESLDHSFEDLSERRSSDLSSRSENDEVLSVSVYHSLTRYKDEIGSAPFTQADISDEFLSYSSPINELEDIGVDAELYQKLQDALIEAGNSKREAYEESIRRQRAERDAFEAIRRVKASENLYAKEVKLCKEIQEAFERQCLELEALKNQKDELSEKHQKMYKEKLELELRLADSDNFINDLDGKLSAAHDYQSSLQEERDVLRRERDEAVREAQNLHRKKEETPKIYDCTNVSEFTLSEIEQSTRGFVSSLKIGEGGYGTVYKGFLRNTTVAVKMLNRDSMQSRLEFNQEIDVLSRVRHPNLVTLIGACSEAQALIYEYLPNGSLEDCLTCKNNTALTWQARTRIIAEICSALMFLHSSKPHPVVHGDLKPANILLDGNLVSKVSDFGLSRSIVQSDATTNLYRHTHPKGTFAYMDPEFLATGNLTPRSDVYSLGVIILRLLTGRHALGIAKQVQEAMDKGALHGIVDPSAGDWPFVQAQQLANMGLRCCEMARKNRPDLAVDVWKILEPMRRAASFSVSHTSFGSNMEDNSCIPNHFLCPIFQEVMRDPHIAADGFTYEAEAIQGWLDGGHNSSPMTNLKLAHCELIPNRALRSAIQEWKQHQQQQQIRLFNY